MGNKSENAKIEPFSLRNAAEWILLRCSGVSLSIIYADSCKQCRGTYMTIGGIILAIVTITSSLVGYAVFTVVNADSKVTTLEHPLLDPETKNNVEELINRKCAVEQEIQQVAQEIQKLKLPSEANSGALTAWQLSGSQDSNKLAPQGCIENPPESQLAKGSNTQVPTSLIIAIVSGMVWGVAIFCLDRLIISGTRKAVVLDKNAGNESSPLDKVKVGAAKVLMISSRLGFAIVIGWLCDFYSCGNSNV